MMKTTLATIMTLLVGAAAAAPTPCSTWAEMRDALQSGKDAILTTDVNQGDNTRIELKTASDVTLDLNGRKLVGSALTDVQHRVFQLSGAGVRLTIEDTAGDGMIDGCGVQRQNTTGGGFIRMDNDTASFTLKGGTIANFGTMSTGGAICAEKGTLRIEGGTITNCTSLGGGGGIYSSGSFDMSGGSVVGCSSEAYGGGVCADSCTMTLSGGEIAYNRAPANANGLNLTGSTTFVMTGGRIHHNANLDSITGSPAGGGGVTVWRGATATIAGGEICDNAASGQGGGIRFCGKALTLAGGTIRGNAAQDGAGVAVIGIDNATTVFNMTGGCIASNTCSRWGGGVYLSNSNGSQMNFSAGEIVGNVNTGTDSGSYSGKGCGIHSSGCLKMSGGKVSDNSSASGGDAIFFNCNGSSISGGIISGTVEKANGSLTVDGGLFDRVPGHLATGYAATALPNVTPATYVVGKNVGFTRGGLSSGSMGFNPSERLYKEAGVTLADGCHVTRSGNGYAVVAVRGTPLAGLVNEAIAFHGFLTKADGTPLKENTVVKVDFKLYPSANAGAELLWARRIPVTIDVYSGYYVDITDTVGQSYQAPGGTKPTCATLRTALARHAQLSPGPLWIAYEPVEATVATPFPRVPLYFQPLAQRASSASQVTVASVSSVETKTLDATDASTVTADRLVLDTDLVRLNGLSFDVPHRDITLNASGAVKIRSVTGLKCSAATNTLGALLADLPATADSDCGRVVKHVVNGVETLAALYYSKGDATTLPEGSTNVYVWSFGPLVKTTNSTSAE